MANPIRAFLDYVPSVDESCFVDETSVVIGEVSLAEDVSIWPYAVLRGDVNSISSASAVMCRTAAFCMCRIRMRRSLTVRL